MRSLHICAAFVLALLLAAPIAAHADSRSFSAHLSGDEEVPPVETRAQGQAHFVLSKDGTTLHYKVNVANIEDVTASHIHIAEEGVNGPVAVTLFSGVPEGRIQGTLAEGDITAADVTLGTFEELLARIRAGSAYVNVHTIENPPGEIRGQIR